MLASSCRALPQLRNAWPVLPQVCKPEEAFDLGSRIRLARRMPSNLGPQLLRHSASMAFLFDGTLYYHLAHER